MSDNMLREKIAEIVARARVSAAPSKYYADLILALPEIAALDRDSQVSRPFNAWDGGAKVLGAIKEVLKCNGPIETAMKHGEAALRDLCEPVPASPPA